MSDVRAEHVSEHAGPAETTQERVRVAIARVGGYWRPLAALARLQEELGELAELLASPSPDAERCASELADLWIITAALADQFLAHVAEPGSRLPPGSRSPSGTQRTTGLPTPPGSHPNPRSPAPDPLGGLVVAAGRVARIVNHYDGPKAPRTFEGWVSLEEGVAQLHGALADAARAHGVDLAAAVGEKLDTIPALDSGRFRESGHDPSTAVSLERFRPVQAAGGCSCAELERLWGGPEWSSEDRVRNVRVMAADLIAFAKAAPWERLEGYLIRGPSPVSGEALDDWLSRLLGEVSERDPAAGRVWPGSAGAGWGLDFGGESLSVAVFSPLHHPGHPHHSPFGTFVLLRARSVVGDRPCAMIA